MFLQNCRGTVEQNADQRGVAVEIGGRFDFHFFIDAAQLFNDAWQVALGMSSGREKVRQNHYARGAALHQTFDGTWQVRFGDFEKRGLGNIAGTGGHAGGHIVNGLVCRSHRGPVCEHDQRSHAGRISGAEAGSATCGALPNEPRNRRPYRR